MNISQCLEITDDIKLRYPNVRVGILGGTFNPIHNGHISMALNIKNEFALSCVLLMPSKRPPHKKDSSVVVPAEKRLRMTALATCGNPDLLVSDNEIQRDGTTYTVDTMRALTLQYKQADFYFIIGSDSLFELECWKQFSELVRLTKFVCVRRQEHDALTVAAEATRLRERYQADIFISQHQGLHVSSSYIRKRIAQDKPISDFVPALVEEYIIASGLYK